MGAFKFVQNKNANVQGCETAQIRTCSTRIVQSKLAGMIRSAKKLQEITAQSALSFNDNERFACVIIGL